MTHIYALLLGFIIGLFFYLGYFGWRALRSGHWDASNFFNVLRVPAFDAAHADVLPYLIDPRVEINYETEKDKRSKTYRKRHPYWFLPLDEFKEVVENTEGSP